MSEVNNCVLPDELYYRVEQNVWVRLMDDGSVQVGMTDIAQSLAGNITHCHPQKVGKTIKKFKSLATVESDKWVGPVKSPVAGVLVEANPAVAADPALLNRSPYKAGWIARLEPEDLHADLAEMVRGEAAAEGFRAYMEDKGLSECVHCEGFEV